MLKWRLISSAVIIAGLLLLLLLDYRYPLGGPGLWLLPLALLGGVLMVHELLDLWHERPDCPVAWPIYLATLLIVMAAALPALVAATAGQALRTDGYALLGGTLIAFVLSIGLAWVGELARFQQPGTSTQSVAMSLLATCCAGVLLSFLVSLRLLGGHQAGMIALISMIVIVKSSDAGAYFAGRLLGRHKMAPRLSPGKTVEGAIGGVMCACLASWLIFAYVVPGLLPATAPIGQPWSWVLYGLLLAGAGMLGDLAESLLKRDANRKDSSAWLPGLGGVLDILDSVIFAAPVAFFCWEVGLLRV